MKKVVLNRPVALAPLPPPPPPPPAPLEAPPLVEAPPAPPPPPPPEPAFVPPEDFEGWMKMAMAVRPPRGNLAHAQFFATVAQNYALKQIADELSTLNEFSGAYDDDSEDGEEKAPLRLADAIAEGLLNAVSTLGLEQVLANAKGKA